MILFISLIFSLMLLVPKDCPQGWVLFGSLCYLLLDTPTSEWNDAQSLCQTHGAHLPIMRSAEIVDESDRELIRVARGDVEDEEPKEKAHHEKKRSTEGKLT